MKKSKLNQAYSEIDIYSGTEMDILPDGSLDYDDEVLAQLDYVIAAIHQSFNQSEEEIMKRLENACRNYMFDTSHIQQDVLLVDETVTNRISKINAFSRKTNTIMEINANPKRLI